MATGVSQRRSGEEAHPKIAEKAKAPAKGKVGGFSITVHRALDKVADAIAVVKGVFVDNIRSLHVKEEKLLAKVNDPKTTKTEKKVLTTRLHDIQIKIGQLEKTSNGVKTVEQRLHGAEKTLDQLIKKLEVPVEYRKVEKSSYKSGGFTIDVATETRHHTRINSGAIVELDRIKKDIQQLEKNTAKEIAKHPESAAQLLKINNKIVEAELILHREQLKLKRTQLKEKLETSPRGQKTDPEVRSQLATVEKLIEHAQFQLKPLAVRYSEKFTRLTKLKKELSGAQKNHTRNLDSVRKEYDIVRKETGILAAQMEKEFGSKFPAELRVELELS